MDLRRDPRSRSYDSDAIDHHWSSGGKAYFATAETPPAKQQLQQGSRSGSFGHGGSSSGSSLHALIPPSTSLNSMRDLETLLEFTRVRDAYQTSVDALGRLATAVHHPPPGPAGNASPSGAALRPGHAMRTRERGGPSPRFNANHSLQQRAGGRGGSGAAATAARESMLRGGMPGLAAHVGTDGVSSPPDDATANGHSCTATNSSFCDHTAVDEAAAELGLTANGKSGTLRQALGYVGYAWAEYESVEHKWEAAEEASAYAAARSSEDSMSERQGMVRGPGSGSSSISREDGPPIRRSISEPSLPHAAPSPLALSLSMISSHVHDDDDETLEHEEW